MKNKQDKNTKENVLAVGVRLGIAFGGRLSLFF